MPGHCAVADRNRPSNIYWEYHTEDFIELTEDEL
jgi:hypothetical protein